MLLLDSMSLIEGARTQENIIYHCVVYANEKQGGATKQGHLIKAR